LPKVRRAFPAAAAAAFNAVIYHVLLYVSLASWHSSERSGVRATGPLRGTGIWKFPTGEWRFLTDVRHNDHIG